MENNQSQSEDAVIYWAGIPFACVLGIGYLLRIDNALSVLVAPTASIVSVALRHYIINR